MNRNESSRQVNCAPGGGGTKKTPKKVEGGRGIAWATRGEVDNAMLVAVGGGYSRLSLAGAAPQLRGTPACESDHGS